MTDRDQCIERIARAMDDAHPKLAADCPDEAVHAMATAAYDAMADHIRAERERGEGLMLDKCRDAVSGFMGDVCDAAIACDDADEMRLIHERSHTITAIFHAVNAIDIGGKTDG